MHHLPSPPLRTPSQFIAALIIAIGCSDGRTSEVRVLLDSTQLRESLEVIALPFDPATLEPEATASGPRTDSLHQLRTVADSAERLAERFSHDRARINADVAELRRQDRTSAEYARREAALRRRIAEAEALRAERDRTRIRVRELASALGVDEDAGTPVRIAWSQVEGALRGGDRSFVSATARDTVVLRAPAGRWWLTLGASGEFIFRRASEVELASGEQTTVRLPH